MKTSRFSSLVLLAVLALYGASAGRAQDFIDTVTITAPDASASETGPDPGRFEIRRSGPTNFGVMVFYRIGGTASNGVDYEGISSSVMIEQGSFTASIP